MIFVKENLTVNTFSEWLVKYRGESGLSLRELEKAINKICTFGYINQLEKGIAGKKGQSWQPDTEIVDALAAALGRPIGEARAAAGYFSEEIAPGWFSGIEKLSPQNQDLAKKQVRAIIDTLIEQEHDFDYGNFDDE